jgi:hypothetical protein
MATIHLTKGAPKSTRLDEASIRKRAATKGDVIVEVKPGEEVVSVNVGWTVEKFVAVSSGRENGKKNGRVKASANGQKKVESGKRRPERAEGKKEARGKTSSAKGKAAPVKKAKAPAKKSAPKQSATKAKPAKKSVKKKK